MFFTYSTITSEIVAVISCSRILLQDVILCELFEFYPKLDMCNDKINTPPLALDFSYSWNFVIFIKLWYHFGIVPSPHFFQGAQLVHLAPLFVSQGFQIFIFLRLIFKVIVPFVNPVFLPNWIVKLWLWWRCYWLLDESFHYTRLFLWRHLIWPWFIFYVHLFSHSVALLFFRYIFPRMLIFENGILFFHWFICTAGSHIVSEWKWQNWNWVHGGFTVNHCGFQYLNFNESGRWCYCFLNWTRALRFRFTWRVKLWDVKLHII